MDDWQKFEENHLPPAEAFHSKLNMSRISECYYDHAQRVWKEFWDEEFEDYHDLYLRTDLSLLSNVFETFRTTCMKHYGLDLAHFYTSPGLVWQVCLKKTGVNP